jgi:hypothetical protein
MLTVILILAAALVLGGKDLLAKGRELAELLPRPEVSWRQIAAAGLLIGAVVAFNWQQSATPGPTPPPIPSGPLDLRGLFTGPSGAVDAALVAAMTGELADELEWDGTQAEPFFRSGVAIDDLRQRTRELRCRGESIGSRQPAARDAIAGHLERAVGVSGGPITPEQRAAWVRALTEISEAATLVTK